VYSELLPRISPFLLRRADDLCARRLAREMDGPRGSHDPLHRARLRDAFLARARDLHATVHAPTAGDFVGAGDDLEAEEQLVLAQAARWYAVMFADRAVRYHDHGLEHPSPSRRRGVRIGGWVDLAVVGADGAKEYRHLDLWAGRPPDNEPLDLETVRVAVLRLRRWVGDDPLRVVWADLLRGDLREQTVRLGGEDDLDPLVDWFDERLDLARARAAEPLPTMGDDCRTCRHVALCPAHPDGATPWVRSRDVLPGILHVTPTSLDRWDRCVREWRNADVLRIPRSDADGGGDHGSRTHGLLRLVHQEGSCRDPSHVDDVLARHGVEDDVRIRSELASHLRRCPEGATGLGHEVTRARFHRAPSPMFMASARLDAIWSYDGVLDAHDYKTGRSWVERVADDRQARVQAWTLAPLAEELGLRLRITFEQLSPEVTDDPVPFEPDIDDVRAIEEELRATVEAMRSVADWHGVSDREVCERCDYRSLCPDSAAPGVPRWPMVESEARSDGS
jgi:hypothetical protein